MTALASHPLRIFLVLSAGLLASCGNDIVAGKTTTTTNGGGGVVALAPDGSPSPGCIVLAARSWDAVGGKPASVDTLHGDSAGFVAFPQEDYAFFEIRSRTRDLGTWVKRPTLHDGIRQTILLDTLRSFRGRWADRSSIARGRLFLDSSFQSTQLGVDDSFAFEKVPTGTYLLSVDADAQPLRPMGSVLLGSREVRFTGSGNVIVAGDTTGSPLWIDDFESESLTPSIRRSFPQASRWYMWWTQMTMSNPTGTDATSLSRAFGPDSVRGGKTFHARFASASPDAWVAVGITDLELNLTSRTQLCFGYRADSLIKIQFQRDSLDGFRPTLSASVPSSRQWRDVCVPIADFTPDAQTTDSLKTWAAFGRRVLVIEFQTPAGGTYLELDDVRLR
ncbi:MAG: hypothetical protein IPK50_14025 [Fibrobacterota bacterium]|nr:hypothetical protein [Fibrobacterota bacterium]QQS03418.1 MAG: hypothetical protein IPK50_14025 [Fibrobacterota bacterium]